MKKEDYIEDKNTDGMRSKIKSENKYEISSEKLANFMNDINLKKNRKNIGTWSIRNIRKIVRRYSYQQFNEKSYINVSFELQIVIYILSEIPTDKRKEALKEILEILNKIFKPEESAITKIEEVINGPPNIDKKNINNEEKIYLYKGESGIEIEKDFYELKYLSSLMETLFYAKFANAKEPINFCGPSSYKTFIAKKLSHGADVINLYSETSIEQLLGSINIVNNYESKIYYLEKILKINGNEEKLIEYKKIIKNYFDKKIEREKSKDESRKNALKKEFEKAYDSFKGLNELIIEENEKKKKDKNDVLPDCIYLVLESLRNKLFFKDKENKGFFKDFTSIFKSGILLEKILKRSPIILINLSNLSTAVLERFNDLFNYDPKLTLNEDFCNTFTDNLNPKELNNFSNKFKIISISSLAGIRNLSDAARSRFYYIHFRI